MSIEMERIHDCEGTILCDGLSELKLLKGNDYTIRRGYIIRELSRICKSFHLKAFTIHSDRNSRETIATAVTQLTGLTTLKLIDISWGFVKENDCGIELSLRIHRLTKLTHLGLSDNFWIGSVALIRIIKAMPKRKLKVLIRQKTKFIECVAKALLLIKRFSALP